MHSRHIQNPKPVCHRRTPQSIGRFQYGLLLLGGVLSQVYSVTPRQLSQCPLWVHGV
jgi:hypothetical protein